MPLMKIEQLPYLPFKNAFGARKRKPHEAAYGVSWFGFVHWATGKKGRWSWCSAIAGDEKDALDRLYSDAQRL